MITRPATTDFERLMLPHLEAAYRLAYWLTRQDATAQDIVQDSLLRAFQAWDRYEAGNARAWLLTIVRRQSYSWLKQDRARVFVDIDDEGAFATADQPALSYDEAQESGLMAAQSAARLRAALEDLPPGYREVIILKDLEDMAYKDIARILDVPMGTVMSRLARGRDLLRRALVGESTADKASARAEVRS